MTGLATTAAMAVRFTVVARAFKRVRGTKEEKKWCASTTGIPRVPPRC
jgi:hypothetical protein